MGCFFNVLFIFFHVEEKDQKKTPVLRSALRVSAKAGACRDSIRSNRPTRLFPALALMLGAGQRGGRQTSKD